MELTIEQIIEEYYKKQEELKENEKTIERYKKIEDRVNNINEILLGNIDGNVEKYFDYIKEKKELQDELKDLGELNTIKENQEKLKKELEELEQKIETEEKRIKKTIEDSQNALEEINKFKNNKKAVKVSVKLHNNSSKKTDNTTLTHVSSEKHTEKPIKKLVLVKKNIITNPINKQETKKEEAYTDATENFGSHVQDLLGFFEETPAPSAPKYEAPKFEEAPTPRAPIYVEPKFEEAPTPRAPIYVAPKFGEAPTPRTPRYEAPKFEEAPTPRTPRYEAPKEISEEEAKKMVTQVLEEIPSEPTTQKGKKGIMKKIKHMVPKSKKKQDLEEAISELENPIKEEANKEAQYVYKKGIK